MLNTTKITRPRPRHPGSLSTAVRCRNNFYRKIPSFQKLRDLVKTQRLFSLKTPTTRTFRKNLLTGSAVIRSAVSRLRGVVHASDGVNMYSLHHYGMDTVQAGRLDIRILHR